MGLGALRVRCTLAITFVATTATGCARDERGPAEADQNLRTERISLGVAALPVEKVVVALEAYSEMEKKLGGERSSIPIPKTDQEAISNEWRRCSSVFSAAPTGTWDRALTDDERAKEREHLRTMRDALGKIRALLAPHRAWVEEHFGKEVFGDV